MKGKFSSSLFLLFLIQVIAVGCAGIFNIKSFEVPSKYPEMEAMIYDLINRHRVEAGLNALEWSEIVAYYCRTHCVRMAEANTYFGHDGFGRRARMIRLMMPFYRTGENVAHNYGFKDPSHVAFEQWLESPGHRENIEGDFRVTGIGVDRGENGHYYFTQIFVKPA